MKFFLSCLAVVTLVAAPISMANEFDTYDQECRLELGYLVCK